MQVAAIRRVCVRRTSTSRATLTAVSDAVLALVVAGATAIGAGVGGAITGWISLRAEDRRQDFLRETAREQASDELLVALRQVANELLDLGAMLRTSADRGERGLLEIRMDEWEEHGPTLARVLGNDDWSTVSIAYRVVDTLRVGLDLETDDDRIGSKQYEGAQAYVEKAQAALQPYVALAGLRLEQRAPGTKPDATVSQ